jgi:hypothetical protein
VLEHKIGDLGGSSILGGIVYENNVVIAVVLLEDRVDVIQVSIRLHILETGHNDAEGQLLVLGNVVFLLIVLFLQLG